MRRILAGLAVAGAVFSGGSVIPAHAADLQPIAAYSLVAPVGASPSGLVARAIVPQGVPCPNLSVVRVNGSRAFVRMVRRAAPSTTGPAFAAFTACTVDIPANAVQAHVGAIPIPAAMPTSIKRMAIFGDSGCRIKGTTVQDCTSAGTWPLARIAASIASEHPDLIVFTGDFFYRESPCPDAQTALCGGSPEPINGLPFKDGAYGWAADVFTPMSPMFSAAPIVVTRGNHEACYRGGNGYFIYMDPRKGTEGNCAPAAGPDGSLAVPSGDIEPTYAADIPVSATRTLRLVVVDSANGSDCSPSGIAPLQRTRYERAQQLARGHESWLIVHRPVVAWQPNDDCAATGAWISADQVVGSAGLLSPFQMLLSSHIHVAQAVNIPRLPGQLVIGNGGTMLDAVIGPVPVGAPAFGGVSYDAPTSFWQAARFGYVLASPAGARDWTMQMHEPSGSVFASCQLKDKRIACRDR